MLEFDRLFSARVFNEGLSRIARLHRRDGLMARFEADIALPDVGTAHVAVEASGEVGSSHPGDICAAHSGNETRPAKPAHVGAREAAFLATIEAMPAVEPIPTSVAVAAVNARAVAIREADVRSVVTIVVPVR
jgi:hypothetical protein